MVGAELKFKSVRSAAFGASRHTSNLSKNVELLALGVEIEVQESNSLILGDVAKGALGLLDVPGYKVQSGSGAEQSACSFNSKAGGAASDQNDLTHETSFEGLVANHFGGGGASIPWLLTITL